MNEPSFLDLSDSLAALDPTNMLESAKSLPRQIEDAWNQHHDVSIQTTPITNIVVSGMGGSALGAHVVRSVFKQELTVPLTIVNNYHLPEFVNEHTLVICSSYSGTTEETLATFNEARQKKAQVVVMATGGELISKANEAGTPAFKLQVNHNPSNQPRMAIGYMVTALIGILSQAHLLSIQNENIQEIVSLLDSRTSQLTGPTESNPAKKLAFELYDKIVFLVSADHLTGAFHVLNNQINENAKQLTVELQLPELNHHYMEALSFPKYIPNQGIFLFADSPLYHERNRRRVELTQRIVEKAGFMSATVNVSSGSKLSQAFEAIHMGMFTNLYLAFLNGINPAPIPNVDFFKGELLKNS